ncbi:MAG: hypothetical protein JXA03_16610 [Bacteroidales bacterium]|nr:hypothetical protein [Bacteroidales bacterium]
MNKHLLILWIAFLVSAVGFAQWSSDPAVNNPIATVSGEEAIPKIATAAGGTSYISWFSNEGGNYNVRLQKLDVYGNQLWANEGLLISAHPAMTWLTDWDLAVDPQEHAIIAFQDIRTGNNNIHVYRIAPDGTFTWGPDGLQLSSSSAFSASPKVTVTASGNCVFAWQEENVIIIQKVSPNGIKLWGDNGITLTSSANLSWPQLLPVGADEVILKYFQDTGPVWAPTRHVFARRYDASGNPLWAQPAVISNAGGISAWTQIFPFINDGNDGFFIAWHDDRDNNMLSSAFVQHISSAGQPLFTANGVEVSTLPNRNRFYPKLCLPPGSSDIFVLWNEMDANQNNRGIYGQKVSSSGNLLWTNNGMTFIELSMTDVYPFASGNSDQDLVIFYHSAFSGSNYGIRAMCIDVNGAVLWNNYICSYPSEKVHSFTSPFMNGQWITAWEDDRSGGKDIYAQNIKTDGTLGPVTSSGFDLSLHVFLEGPFDGAEMSAGLNAGNVLPLAQPFNTAPWNYTGTEAVVAIPNAGVVDWILVELRDAASATQATGSTMIAQKAGFLMKDGTVTGIDGQSDLSFTNSIQNSLFVVVWHRNHYGVLAANPLIETGGIYTYDFSSSAGQAYGGMLGHKEIAPGIWGMAGGDGNSDNQVNNDDKIIVWAAQAGNSGYLNGDFDMNAQVNNQDKVDLWAPNSGTGGQVPGE